MTAQKQMIRVEKGVPIPFKKKERPDRLPFSKMNVGDSFFCNDIKGWTAYVYATHWKKRNEKYTWKFKWQPEKDGFRMWRIR